MEGIAKLNKGEIDADTSCQIEKQILTDEIQDAELPNFAVYNISELFGYLATGRVNIRIHRENGPPKRSSGKPARRAVWRARCGLGWGRY